MFYDVLFQFLIYCTEVGPNIPHCAALYRLWLMQSVNTSQSPNNLLHFKSMELKQKDQTTHMTWCACQGLWNLTNRASHVDILTKEETVSRKQSWWLLPNCKYQRQSCYQCSQAATSSSKQSCCRCSKQQLSTAEMMSVLLDSSYQQQSC
jgi:hypothetical protein